MRLKRSSTHSALLNTLSVDGDSLECPLATLCRNLNRDTTFASPPQDNIRRAPDTVTLFLASLSQNSAAPAVLKGPA
jgi:hypothetical protein